jgi:hypothetical protein
VGSRDTTRGWQDVGWQPASHATSLKPTAAK